MPSADRVLDACRRRIQAHPRMFAGAVVALSLGVWTVAGWALWSAQDLSSGLPDRAAIGKLGDMAEATSVFDAFDRPVFTIFKEQRIEVPISRISPLMTQAIVAIEDQRFFDHRGVDLMRVIAAAVSNLRAGRAAQGGSTLTQQLARQSFLTRDKTLRRKVKEVLLAARIERAYSKEEILELYLNKVYFGDGLYGVEAASLGFFGKHASDLDLGEAALLAGLVKSPSTYAPTVSLNRAIARRNIVLQAMRERGSITEEQWSRATRSGVRLEDRLRREEPYGQYFKEQVRLELVQRFGWDRVYEGGLRVFTTLDLDMQKAAEKMVEEGLVEIEERRSALPRFRSAASGTTAADRLQGALIALDPQTGFVRAMVGGRRFAESRFNRAVQARRQPGSAFKPFVFAAALEAGLSPASIIDRLDEPIATLQGAWTPEDEHSDANAMTLRTALRTSSNRAAVRLIEQVGIDETVQYSKRLGLGSVPSVPSLALGSGEVTLESMALAYAAFANGGFALPPVLIRRVEDRDASVLFEEHGTPLRVLGEPTAFLMATMLADVVTYGTAYRARRVGFTLPAGGKTGTTNDFADAWFIGFTPTLLAGVWIGFDQPQTILPNGYAGDLAVPVWAKFMKIATRGDKPVWFTPPAGVVAAQVCRVSGRLPSNGCYDVEVVSSSGEVEHRSLVYTEYFARGTQPVDACPLHPGRSLLDRVAGLFGGGEPPPPLSTAEAAPPVASPPPSNEEPSAAADEARAESTPKKKKRGFWAKLFGIGKDGKEKKETERKPPH